MRPSPSPRVTAYAVLAALFLLAALASRRPELAVLALPFAIRIAFKPIPWSRTVDSIEAAADVLLRADFPGLGIALDAFATFEDPNVFDDLDMLDPERILLVQLSDYLWPQMRSTQEQLATARHFRVFPGEGVHGDTLSTLVTRLDKMGYYGSYSFAVYNDDYRQLPPEVVAGRAQGAAMWLGETVLRRSLPVPNMQRLRPTGPR